ncbi:MAG: hypothetical protein IJZ57_04055 [Clostridia bacterium]|nr:hypothetical protein [Clostridia bacterium]
MKKLTDFNLTDALRSEIESAVKNRRIPHAIIILAGDFQSRIDLATYLSAASLCIDEHSFPCGECRVCKKIFSGIHPDVQYYEREKDKKEFSVKIVRESIKPDAFVKPNEADGRVFIIKDAETMNPSAQNAFLKILEEPPKGVRFILCCDNSASMLETIRSRATVYSLLKDNESDEDDEKSLKLAVELANALTSTNEYEFMSKTGVFEKDKELLKKVISKMQVLCRDALAVKNSSIILSGEKDCAYKLASSLSVKNLINLIGKLNELSDSINKNANLNLLITRFSSVLRQATRG